MERQACEMFPDGLDEIRPLRFGKTVKQLQRLLFFRLHDRQMPGIEPGRKG